MPESTTTEKDLRGFLLLQYSLSGLVKYLVLRRLWRVRNLTARWL